MKLHNIYTISKAETKVLRKYLVFFLLIMSLMHSVSTAMVSFALNVPRMLNENIDALLDDSTYHIKFSWLSDDALMASDVVSSHMTDVHLVAEENLLEDVTICFENKTEQVSVSIIYEPIKNQFSSVCQDSSDDTGNVWISQNTAQLLGVSVNDTLSYSASALQGDYPLIVSGFYEDAQHDSDIILSQSAATDILRLNKKTTYCEGVLFADTYADCKQSYQALLELGATAYSSLFERIEPYKEDARFLKMVFFSVSFFLIAATCGLQYSMIKMQLELRTVNICILHALGASATHTTMVYFYIAERVLIASQLLGMLGGILFSRYINNVLFDLFDLTVLDMDFHFMAVPLVFLLNNVFLIISMIFLRRTIKTIQPTKLFAAVEIN